MDEKFMEDAQAHQDMLREAALSKVLKAASVQESDPDFDGQHCVEARCGVLIPSGRLALGKIRCVDCQSAIEARNKLRRV